MYARQTGKTPFAVYQGAWNVKERSCEREIIPMARANGLSLALRDVLAASNLHTDAEEKRRAKSGEQGRTIWGNWKWNGNARKMSSALEKIAKEKVRAVHITAVAIAYLVQKTPCLPDCRRTLD